MNLKRKLKTVWARSTRSERRKINDQTFLTYDAASSSEMTAALTAPLLLRWVADGGGSWITGSWSSIPKLLASS